MDFLPFLIGVVIVFGLSLFYSNFVVLLIEERESKVYIYLIIHTCTCVFVLVFYII